MTTTTTARKSIVARNNLNLYPSFVCASHANLPPPNAETRARVRTQTVQAVYLGAVHVCVSARTLAYSAAATTPTRNVRIWMQRGRGGKGSSWGGAHIESHATCGRSCRRLTSHRRSNSSRDARCRTMCVPTKHTTPPPVPQCRDTTHIPNLSNTHTHIEVPPYICWVECVCACPNIGTNARARGRTFRTCSTSERKTHPNIWLNASQSNKRTGGRADGVHTHVLAIYGLECVGPARDAASLLHTLTHIQHRSNMIPMCRRRRRTMCHTSLL